ncbi:PSP1 C-terminal [Penicillium cosmopolitanum]|uniref:PSP1 C-terminal n=1 Tax=Penicillium cosmopolitanum TaxID=1131564 RepID=A0A9W9W515_9EURO|nr:PSP1 C-terminal [Penicillium cosmopolitanum]KAJ5403535.1 PSP1 C-terminal [Penicillium cosmopolitanum]
MSAPPHKQMSGTPPLPATNATRLEKGHPGVRRSTPDSEALASSDDDGEHNPLSQTITAPATKPVRRTSWLNEVPISIQRKHSLPGGPLASAPSNPASPSGDQPPWASSTSPGLSSSFNWNQSGGSQYPWGTGIWNTESRKEPPPRLSEIVPSPTMTNPPAVNASLGDEMLSPITRTISGESAIPFSIPLHPTPKTYRSQSYSVGQMDPEFLGLAANKPSTGGAYPNPSGRSRGPGQMSSGQPRASRPSVLGELGHDSAMLGRVREDDDGESSLGSDGDVAYSASQARTIEQLARENALLRQAAAAGQRDNRYRDRASSSASTASGLHAAHRIHGGVPEEDIAPEDPGELRDIHGYGIMRGNTGRRYSEHSANLEQQFSSFASSPLENRALENVRKGHWQTSLGFGSMADIPQSRRHSFADIPMRHASVSSVDSHATATPRAALGERDDGYGNAGDYPNPSMQPREYSALHQYPTEPALNPTHLPESYYPREQTLRGDGTSGIPAALNQYAMSGAYGRQPPALSHAHQNQLLYIVTFKCHRADVFYIQEDTGLQVKSGDLVIVEADRGTDLGTVQHANVSLQKARELKQQYAEEHYKWLMMFSRQGQVEGSNVGNPGLNTRGATGGMGPHAPGVQEPATDIKPKLIKRLAQNHEILTLRDKEGNEAKAKRVCQQKVVEHRLNMEILDAEFQMDWKKLTFYYFADSYINFNSLVTDLFKIYKTRIWMSAINPASFVTPPSAGLPGPGSMSNPLYSQDQQHPDRRHQHEGSAYGGRDPIDAGRENMPNPVGALRTAFTDSYQPFAQPTRQIDTAQGDPFGPMDPGFADYPSGGAGNAAARMHPAQTEWTSRFQGLSLNS